MNNDISLIQFEDKDGKSLSDVLQVPNNIDVDQMKSLINTTQDLYINGSKILNNLQESLSNTQINDIEEIKKIRLSEELPSTTPAIYCSSTYSGHEGPVLAVKIFDKILISSGGDKTVRFWDLLTKTQKNIVQKHNHWVQCIDLNEKYVVSGGMDNSINLYDHEGNYLKKFLRHRL
ncbi:MAG: hypothetical protein KC414_15020, partial [Romboutsia sp.]|nr:hypothetical protein [Romboutsia sp.]